MKNILRSFWITLTRFKMASILNITGLSIAFAVFSIITMQVYWEFTFNKNFKDYEKIFRLETGLMKDDSRQINISRPMGELVGQNSASIVEYTMILNNGKVGMIAYDGQGQKVDVSVNFNTVTPSFPSVMSMECLEGDFVKLSEPDAAIISQSDAEKIFSGESAIGKTLIDSWDTLNIVGVYKDLPENCSFTNGVFVNIGDESLKNSSQWNYHYYYKLVDKSAMQTIKSDVVNTLTDYFKDQFAKATSEEIEKKNEKIANATYITPMADIYFEGEGSLAQGNYTLVLVLIAIAVLIIGIAVINFINFFMAMVPIRLRSVTINKVFGTPTSAIRFNIIGEAVGTVLVAFFISLCLVEVAFYTGVKDMVAASIMLSDNVVLLSCVGVLAGLYPAFFITKFSPMAILRGSYGRSKSGQKLRIALVGFQFVISIGLIIVAMFIYLQADFMKSHDMGYNRDRLITVKVGNVIAKQPQTFIDKLEQSTVIEGVAFSDFNIVNVNMGWGRSYKGERIYLTSLPVSWNYPEFMNIKLVEGRSFIQQDASKTNGTMIINQAASDAYGIKVGEFLQGHSSEPAEVVGIAANFNFESLKYAVEPMVLYEFGSDGWRMPSVANIRIAKDADFNQVEAFVKSVIKELEPTVLDELINIRPFNEIVESLYQKEQKLNDIISLFSMVAIIISLVGVFGLVVFEVQYRRKEISLRKVHGASWVSIPIMINKKFVYITLFSALLAIPVAYIGVNSWLGNFEYQVRLYWWVALCAVSLVWLITLIVVTVQTMKAAMENPINALKKE